MLTRIWNKFINFFADMAEENELHAQEIRRKQLAKYQENRRTCEKQQINDAVKRFTEIENKRIKTIEKQFDSIHYQEFETVMEMVYVLQKAHYAQQKSAWSKEQKEDFTKKFNANLARCQRRLKFRKDYDDYIEASEREVIGNPKTQRDITLKQIKEEVRLIDLACQPLTSDEETAKQQRATRFRYEQSLYRIKKRKEQTQQRRGRVISI